MLLNQQAFGPYDVLPTPLRLTELCIDSISSYKTHQFEDESKLRNHKYLEN